MTNRTLSHQYFTKIILNQIVGILSGKILRSLELGVEAIAPQFKLFGIGEISVRAQGIFRHKRHLT